MFQDTDVSGHGCVMKGCNWDKGAGERLGLGVRTALGTSWVTGTSAVLFLSGSHQSQAEAPSAGLTGGHSERDSVSLSTSTRSEGYVQGLAALSHQPGWWL